MRCVFDYFGQGSIYRYSQLTEYLARRLRVKPINSVDDLEDYAKPPEWATGTRALKY